MKIIAKTSNGFLLEASNDDIRALLTQTDSRRGEISKIEIGTEITFTTALSNLSLLRDVRMSQNNSSILINLKNSRIALDEIIIRIENTEKDLSIIQKKIITQQV